MIRNAFHINPLAPKWSPKYPGNWQPRQCLVPQDPSLLRPLEGVELLPPKYRARIVAERANIGWPREMRPMGMKKGTFTDIPLRMFMSQRHVFNMIHMAYLGHAVSLTEFYLTKYLLRRVEPLWFGIHCYRAVETKAIVRGKADKKVRRAMHRMLERYGYDRKGRKTAIASAPTQRPENGPEANLENGSEEDFKNRTGEILDKRTKKDRQVVELHGTVTFLIKDSKSLLKLEDERVDEYFDACFRFMQKFLGRDESGHNVGPVWSLEELAEKARREEKEEADAKRAKRAAHRQSLHGV